jgi:hypothetical protein
LVSGLVQLCCVSCCYHIPCNRVLVNHSFPVGLYCSGEGPLHIISLLLTPLNANFYLQCLPLPFDTLRQYLRATGPVAVASAPRIRASKQDSGFTWSCPVDHQRELLPRLHYLTCRLDGPHPSHLPPGLLLWFVSTPSLTLSCLQCHQLSLHVVKRSSVWGRCVLCDMYCCPTPMPSPPVSSAVCS